MKRIELIKVIGLAMLCAVVAGCPAPKSGKIIIRGSNTVGEELAPRLIEEYRKAHPSITFDIETKGTSYGIGALMVSRCDIAAASRPLSTNELALAKDRGIEFNQYEIGTYSVAVIVNAASPVANLTQAQVRDIFTGAVQNWKAFGGPDAPIHLFIRDPISGTYLGFQELAMDRKPYALGLKTLNSYADIVREVAADPNAIGYAGPDLAGNVGVKAISIDGVAASAASINKGEYPYVRALRLFTRKGGETPEAKAFVDFILSASGQEVLTKTGFARRP